MRLAALFGPDALAHAPRASRQSRRRTRARRRRAAGADARGGGDRPASRRGPHAGHRRELRRGRRSWNPGINPASIARRVRGTRWKMVDRSESGCRLMAPAKEAPAKLGELLAIKDGDNWILGVVRRMQRQQVDEMTVGVEIIARRLVRVLMRSWAAPADASRAAQRPAVLRHLPARRAGKPPVVAAQPHRARRPLHAGRDGRARHRQRALSHPLHPDARAPGGLDVGAVQRRAQAVHLEFADAAGGKCRSDRAVRR